MSLKHVSLKFFKFLASATPEHPHFTCLRHKQRVGLGYNKKLFDITFREEGVGKTCSSFTLDPDSNEKFELSESKDEQPSVLTGHTFVQILLSGVRLQE